MNAEVLGVVENNRRFTMEDLGIETERQALIDLISGAPAASIVFVKRYKSKGGHGEVADQFFLKGIDYGAMKAKSLVQLSALEVDSDFELPVSWSEWWDTVKDKKTTAAAKNKELRKFKTTFHAGDHRLTAAFAAVRQSLEAPRSQKKTYEKEGNGIYTQVTDEGFCLHMRDCQAFHKTLVKKGDYPIKTTSEKKAIENALRRLLTISKYRQARLDGRCDYITVAGQVIMQSDGGTQTFVGFKEHAGLIQTRMPEIDDEIEMEKIDKGNEIIFSEVESML